MTRTTSDSLAKSITREKWWSPRSSMAVTLETWLTTQSSKTCTILRFGLQPWESWWFSNPFTTLRLLSKSISWSTSSHHQSSSSSRCLSLTLPTWCLSLDSTLGLWWDSSQMNSNSFSPVTTLFSTGTNSIKVRKRIRSTIIEMYLILPLKPIRIEQSLPSSTISLSTRTTTSAPSFSVKTSLKS